MDPER
jgi:hypothetical protein